MEIKDIELDRRQNEKEHYAVAQHIVPTEISVLSHSAEKR
jgi:hypothetical protein